MRQRPSLGAPEVPPDVPPEFADAYLRGYARARAEATTITPTGEPADAVDVPELPPSLTGFVIPEEGPAVPAPRVAPARRASLRRPGTTADPTATRSPFPSPRPGSAVRPPVPAEAPVEAGVEPPVLGDVVDGQVVAAPDVVPEAPRMVPVEVEVEALPVEPVPVAEPAEPAEPTSRQSSSEPFVPWAFEPPRTGDQETPRRWQFEPPEEHTANVALDILEAEERVPGTAWTFEPPVADVTDVADETPTLVDVLLGVEPEADTVAGPEPAATPPAREQHDDLVPGMRTYYRTDGAVYADAEPTAATTAEVAPWMIPMMTMSLIAALFLAVFVLAR